MICELKSWFRAETRHTREFDGCNWITIHTDQDDPNHLLVLGNWDSRAHHERYLAWRSESGHIKTIMGWIDGTPTAQYFEDFEE